MATITIQDTIDRDEAVLYKDGYCTFPMHSIDWNRASKQSITSQPQWDELIGKLDECHRDDKHVLLSSGEDMGHIDHRVWRSLLEPAFSRWNVIILVGYQRYYEWLPNFYHQHARTIEDDDTIPTIGEYAQNYAVSTLSYTENSLRHWKSLVQHKGLWKTKIDENELVGKSNNNVFDNGEEEQQQQQQEEQLDSSQSKKGDFNFLIYNMHDDDNVIKTLYCKVLPSTHQACQESSSRTPPDDEDYDDEVSVEYDRLVIAALKKNKLHGLDDSISSSIISNKGEVYMMAKLTQELWEEGWKKRVKDFPRDCLSDNESKGIFVISMKLEQLLVPEYYEEYVSPRLDELEKSFNRMAKNKFCSVNVKKVVKDKNYVYLWNGLNAKFSSPS